MYEDLSLYEMVIVGAGPAGISLAVEAVLSGIDPSKVLVLEKAETHSFSIRKYYPDDKLVTANYKGNDASCEGVLCLLDSSKDETLTYLDQAIEQHQINVRYKESVHEIHKTKMEYFVVKTQDDAYLTKTCAVAIGVLGRPNKPSYPIPGELLKHVQFDVTSSKIEAQDVLIVGGGDSASEYAQFLVQKGNRVSFSYRRDELIRMNDINRESLLELSAQNKVELLLGSDIERLDSQNGRAHVVFKTDHESRSFDKIIYALGGTSPKNFLQTLGIKVTHEGPSVDENYESTKDGLFLVGDISAGNSGGSINVAFNSAHSAMKEFCRSYLDCRVVE